MKRKTNGWEEYKKVILYRLDSQDKKLDALIETLGNMQVDVGGLKTKATIAGGLAGIVATGIVAGALRMFGV